MTLEAIGQKLKAAREGQGLSLRQIYERTKIPINHLQAIDTGQPDDLPEPVYVAGFIKRYAECIGLDGQVLADEYRRVDGNGNGNPKQQYAPPAYATHEYLKHTKIDNGPPSYKLWPFWAIAILVVIAITSWYSIHYKDNQLPPADLSLKDSMSQMQQQPGQTPQAATVATTGTSQASAATGATEPPPAATKDNQIALTAKEHAWITVKRLGNGESIYTGFMEQGDRRTFEDPQGLRVTVGRGASISLESKGKIEPFGLPGTRTERTFSFSGQGVTTSTGGQPERSTTAAASSTGSGSSSSSTSSSSHTATAATDAKPKKATPKPSNTVRHVQGDDGTRSIPGNDGMRSIDVPYRYSDGHN